MLRIQNTESYGFESLIAENVAGHLKLCIRVDENGHANIYLSKEQWKDLKAEGDKVFNL